jgi:F-type H+-transporting ATPase subunit delta
MTSDTVVAKRYAKALFEVAQAKNIVRDVEEELNGVIGVINSTPELIDFLNHPKISVGDKIELLQKAFSGQLREEVMNTLRLLIERRREAALRVLHREYVDIANEALGQADAVVTTAVALSDEEQRKVSEQFGKLTGKVIRVHNEIDPAILGGMQVRIGDRLYDGSLSGKLTRLQKDLQNNQAL